jgi:hypothetical protein
MSLRLYIDCCQRYPELLDIPNFKISFYTSFIQHSKPRIAFTQTSTDNKAPGGLPTEINDFLQLALDLDSIEAQLCWTALKDFAWNEPEIVPRDLGTFIPFFLKHGVRVGICKYLHCKYCVVLMTCSVLQLFVTFFLRIANVIVQAARTTLFNTILAAYGEELKKSN